MTNQPITLHACRYCDRPFPRYRFIPGENPHPTANPKGHSYHPPGQPPPPVPWVAPQRWSESVDYRYGVDLYNHGYWWEAHEAWEGLWQRTDKAGAQGRYLQGIIQVSACHLKRHVGHVDGVKRLLDTSLRHLRGLFPALNSQRYMGLDVADFVSRVELYYAPCSPTLVPHDSASYPYITPKE